MTFVNGDRIEVTCEDRTVEGVVVLISPNQISAMIEFEAILGGHVAMMPIMAATSTDAARGIYHSIVDGTAVTIRSKT